MADSSIDRSYLDAIPAPCCKLCNCIENGQLKDIGQYINVETAASDDKAVYSIINYYKNFLYSHPLSNNVKKLALWKDSDIVNSKSRLNILNGLKLMLEAGHDPNKCFSNETCLMAAVRTHDISVIHLLLEYGADVNAFGSGLRLNAFALAIILNDSKTVEKMLHFGADVNNQCHLNLTPLQLAMYESADISRLLIQSGADIEQVLNVDSWSENSLYHAGTPLCQAMIGDNKYLVLVLLEHNEDVNQTYGNDEETLLHFAVKYGNYDMVKYCVQFGTHLNQLSGSGHSALGLSILSKDQNGTKIAQFLLDAGCSHKRQTMIEVFNKLYPPIFVACFMGNVTIVNKLIKMGQNKFQNAISSDDNNQVPHKDESTDHDMNQDEPNKSLFNFVTLDGCTPLLMAARGGHCILVQQLLILGADPHATSLSQGNLIHASISSTRGNCLDLLRLAVDSGCDLNQKNTAGNTPLHLAARMNQPDICRYLVEQGAQLNVRDRCGETALWSSVYFGCEENSRILIQHGADMDIVDASGTTAIFWSIFNGRESILKLLLCAGARFTPEIFAKYPRNLRITRSREVVAFIHEHICQPRSLTALCALHVRSIISKQAKGQSIKVGVDQLNVPSKVKDSLLFNNCSSNS